MMNYLVNGDQFSAQPTGAGPTTALSFYAAWTDDNTAVPLNTLTDGIGLSTISGTGITALIGTRGVKGVRGMGGLIGLVVGDEPAKVVARLTEAGHLKQAYMEAESGQRQLKAAIDEISPNAEVSHGGGDKRGT